LDEASPPAETLMAPPPAFGSVGPLAWLPVKVDLVS